MAKPFHIRLGCGHWLRDLSAAQAESMRAAAAMTCPECGSNTVATSDVKLGGLSLRQSRLRLAQRDTNRAIRTIDHFARPLDKDFD